MQKISENKSGSDENKKTISLNKRNATLIAIIIVLCTILNIISNYYFSNYTTNSIYKILSELEYSKTWWEENYKLLREIQKDQMLKYVEDIKKSDPDYIEWIKRKYMSQEDLKKAMTLTEEEIWIFKNNSLILWSSWAKLSLIEFSDFECSYCREFHNKWIIEKVLWENKENINYIFKNLPSDKHKNAFLLAQIWSCIYKKTDWDSYKKYIDWVFAQTQWEWENLDIEKIKNDYAKKFNIKIEDINSCINWEENKKIIENEIWQAVYFELKSTPTIMILNNKNWKYYIFNWDITEQILDNKIKELILK